MRTRQHLLAGVFTTAAVVSTLAFGSGVAAATGHAELVSAPQLAQSSEASHTAGAYGGHSMSNQYGLLNTGRWG